MVSCGVNLTQSRIPGDGISVRDCLAQAGLWACLYGLDYANFVERPSLRVGSTIPWGWVFNYIRVLFWFPSCTVIKHLNQKQAGEKGDLFGLDFNGSSHCGRSQGRSS